MTKKIIDARSDTNGVTTHVKFSGNANFTPIKQAIPMVDNGQVSGAHVVRPSDGRKPFIRTNPDGKKGNNIDEMSGD